MIMASNVGCQNYSTDRPREPSNFGSTTRTIVLSVLPGYGQCAEPPHVFYVFKNCCWPKILPAFTDKDVRATHPRSVLNYHLIHSICSYSNIMSQNYVNLAVIVRSPTCSSKVTGV